MKILITSIEKLRSSPGYNKDADITIAISAGPNFKVILKDPSNKEAEQEAREIIANLKKAVA